MPISPAWLGACLNAAKAKDAISSASLACRPRSSS